MIENLRELIGGHETIQRATERFYKKVWEDEHLCHIFRRTDMAHLRSRPVMFIFMLLGGRIYTGKDIHDAHALARDHGLNAAHFDLFLKYFRGSLKGFSNTHLNGRKDHSTDRPDSVWFVGVESCTLRRRLKPERVIRRQIGIAATVSGPHWLLNFD